MSCKFDRIQVSRLADLADDARPLTQAQTPLKSVEASEWSCGQLPAAHSVCQLWM